jgi:hydrogenase maturation protease
MPHVLIIGCGNPLRGDDGLASHALVHLERRPGLRDVALIPCHQLAPELAEPISRADRVIFIDARVSQSPAQTPGLVEARPVERQAPSSSAFSHRFDPPALLEYAQKLYGRRPEAFAVSVIGESFGYGEELSPSIRASLVPLVRQVEALVLADCPLTAKLGDSLRQSCAPS